MVLCRLNCCLTYDNICLCICLCVLLCLLTITILWLRVHFCPSFRVLQIPALHFCPSFSSPAFSCPANSVAPVRILHCNVCANLSITWSKSSAFTMSPWIDDVTQSRSATTGWPKVGHYTVPPSTLANNFTKSLEEITNFQNYFSVRLGTKFGKQWSLCCDTLSVRLMPTLPRQILL